jgi:hypothetical protein
MQSIKVDAETMEWMPATPFYGPGASFAGKDIVQLKVLSDRRAEGGRVAWLVRFTPPEGKVIRIVAVALSDEHILGLEGGRGSKSGAPLRAKGNYGLNPKGKRWLSDSFVRHGAATRRRCRALQRRTIAVPPGLE